MLDDAPEEGEERRRHVHCNARVRGRSVHSAFALVEEVADGQKQKKLVHSRGDDGKALYRVVKGRLGRLGSTFNVDM